MSNEEEKEKKEEKEPKEADTTSNSEPAGSDEREEKSDDKEIVVSESTKRMVNLGRWEGIPRAYYPSLINVLPEIKPAIEEIHQKAIDAIVRKHGEKRGSAMTDIKQIRAIVNRYKDDITETVPGLIDFIEDKMKIFSELIRHMEAVKADWEKKNQSECGNVRYVEELSS